ncbi:uncharacterized protein METZ01_LOCUS204885, partial [marine metagenome]
MVYRLIKLSTIILVLLLATDLRAQSDNPWRLSNALKRSDTFVLTGTHRSRYEALDGQFRAGGIGKDDIFVTRTTLKAQLNVNRSRVVAELMDSRQHLADGGSPLNSTIVNPLELLQAYIAFKIPNSGRDVIQFKLGRHTMDLGSRRLVARNLYRNTINNFTGINGTWKSSSGHQIRAFYVLPVTRLPSARVRVVKNEIETDKEDFDRQFWGMFGERSCLFSNVTGQGYIFSLFEKDNATRNTRNRNLITAGLRLFRRPEKGHVEFEFESVFQTGRSRASAAATDVTDLDHFAFLHHLLLGYTLDIPSALRLVVQFDYASGDSDPADGKNNRYDTLFGARRFEFGPTGIYGAFARSNLVSPGFRIMFNPKQRVNVMAAHRIYWLASSKDAWTTGGVRDVTGNSGSYLGNQQEIRIRWDALPGNLRLESGVAYLIAGGFLKNAPNTSGEGNATY